MVGSEICRRLAAEGKPVKALARVVYPPARQMAAVANPFYPGFGRFY